MPRSSAPKKDKKPTARKPAKDSAFLPRWARVLLIVLGGCVLIAAAINFTNFFSAQYDASLFGKEGKGSALAIPPKPQLDKALYDQKMIQLANNPVPPPPKPKKNPIVGRSVFATSSVISGIISTSSGAFSTAPLIVAGQATGTLAAWSLLGIQPGTATTTAHSIQGLWPAKTVYPEAGAVLPFSRVVAYYGNFLSKGLGVLGQYPEPEMLSRLAAEIEKWRAADPSTPVIPALHYIAVVAQAGAGADGKYRLRMSGDQIEHAIALARQIHGLVFLDIQVGLSDLQSEIPQLAPYLKEPEVHLGIDPEFSIKTKGARPGTIIGTFDAADINYAAQYLAKIVRDNDLPPKILVIHRFTRDMVTHSKDILPLPEVQVVIDMDGWGPEWQKQNTYAKFVHDEPVQFAGFKLFYKNDALSPSAGMMTPAEVLDLRPRPIYIQYQ